MALKDIINATFHRVMCDISLRPITISVIVLKLMHQLPYKNIKP